MSSAPDGIETDVTVCTVSSSFVHWTVLFFPIMTVTFCGENVVNVPGVADPGSIVMKPLALTGVLLTEVGSRMIVVKASPTITTKMNPIRIFAPVPGEGSPSLNRPAGKIMKPRTIM